MGMTMADTRGKLAIPADSPAILWLIGGAFFLVALIGLEVPNNYGFDEEFYVSSAVNLYKGIGVFNREHPMLGKELMALIMSVIGYAPLTWRLGSAIFGTIGLIAFSRAASHWSGSGRVGNITAFLLATNFLLLSLSKSAILDPYLFGFSGVGMAWLAAWSRYGSVWRLALGGAALGLAVACKWTAAPLLAMACALYAIQVRFDPRRLGIGALWLGVVPIALYFATFLPGMWMREEPIMPQDWYALHRAMLAFHGSQFPANIYNSNWIEWMANTGPVWKFHDEQDGIYRLAVLGFNPAQAPLLVLAVALGLMAALRRDWRLVVPTAFFVILIGMWAVNDRTNQYMHYYLLPSTYATIVLAMLVDRWQLRGWIKALLLAVVGLVPMAWFWPVLTSTPLASHAQESRYTWLPGWQISHNSEEYRPTQMSEDLERNLECLMQPRLCLEIGAENLDLEESP